MYKRQAESDHSPLHPRSPAPLLLLSLNVAIFFAVLFNYLLVSPAGPMGRFFFPALSSLAVLIFYGLSLLIGASDNPQSTSEGAATPLSLIHI